MIRLFHLRVCNDIAEVFTTIISIKWSSNNCWHFYTPTVIKEITLFVIFIFNNVFSDHIYYAPFNRIIKLIDTLLDKKGLAEIESCSISNGIDNIPDVTDKALGLTDELDDETSWAEGCLSRSELEDICICHAVHDICTHKPYSIPDLLRMNDFWVEAEVTFQHFASQTNE